MDGTHNMGVPVSYLGDARQNAALNAALRGAARSPCPSWGPPLPGESHIEWYDGYRKRLVLYAEGELFVSPPGWSPGRLS